VLVAVTVTLAAAVPVVVVLVPAAMAATLPARVFVLVALTHPAFTHEIHRLAAGRVAAAIAAPVALVHLGNVEVDRPTRHRNRRRCNQHGLRQNECRRRHVADVDAPVHARLVDADRDADAGLCKHRGDRAGGQHSEQDFLHRVLLECEGPSATLWK
jgi:hypothetical protein